MDLRVELGDSNGHWDDWGGMLKRVREKRMLTIMIAVFCERFIVVDDACVT